MQINHMTEFSLWSQCGWLPVSDLKKKIAIYREHEFTHSKFLKTLPFKMWKQQQHLQNKEQ